MKNNKFVELLKNNWVGGTLAIYISPLFLHGPQIVRNVGDLIGLPFSPIKLAAEVNDCALIYTLIYTAVTYIVGAWIQSKFKK